MKRLLSMLILVVLLAVTLTAAPPITHRVAGAAGPVTMAVSPATASATAGSDVALDITAANIPALPGLGGYLIVLQWNPAVLTLTSITDAGWVTSGQIVVFCDTPTIDNGAGIAEADCTPIFGFGNGVSTSAPRALAHALFHAAAPGSTAIDLASLLTSSELLDPSAVAIASTLVGGTVTVSAPPGVGGIAEAPGLDTLPPPARSRGAPPAAYAIAIVAIAVLLAAGPWLAWRARRRA